MTTRVVASVDINATPDHVWAVLEPIETHVDWMSDAERITFRTPSHRGVDTVFECVTKIGPVRTTDLMVVTEWRPAAVMGIRHHGVVTGRGEFRLGPLAGRRTRLTWDETLHFPARIGGALTATVAKPMLERIWQANLARLRDRIESSTHKSSTGPETRIRPGGCS